MTKVASAATVPVRDGPSAALPRVRAKSQPPLGLRAVADVLYHWLLWVFFTLLLFGQALGIARPRVSATTHFVLGQDPALGTYPVLGENDAPFTDRSFVCALRGGRVFKPVMLQHALESPWSVVVDTSGTAVDGYRMVKRSGLAIDASAMAGYENTCNVLVATMDTIIARCTDLGYNVTHDALRIVGDVNSSTTKLLLDTLPVVVMPFSDNSLHARYALPGSDGSACMVRLSGAYDTKGWPTARCLAVNRSVREQKTIEMLGRPGGVWRNGWYEALDGSRWYSDVLTTDTTEFNLTMREFDVLTNAERDCSVANECEKGYYSTSWGSKLRSVGAAERFTSLTILNGDHYGVFLYDAIWSRSIQSVYDIETVLANASLSVLLMQWAVAMLALQRTYRLGGCELQSTGIGVLSSARGFHWLPVFLLPRLKMNVAIFATAGVSFEGSQSALSQAWFLIYPGIAELVFLGFSLLNLVAKLLRRRMSDALFGPTLVFYCVVHYYRYDLARPSLLGYDGRVASVVTSDVFERMSLLDLLRGNTLLKLGGNVTVLFRIKIAVLALNLVPLLLSKATVSPKTTALTDAEGALALHLRSSGGLGLPRRCSLINESATPATLSGYDVLRLGYAVVDDTWLVSMRDWFLLAVTAPARVRRVTTLRILVFRVTRDDHVRSGATCYVVEQRPVLCRINDTHLADVQVHAIAAQPLR